MAISGAPSSATRMINCDTCHSKQQRCHCRVQRSIIVLEGFEEDTTMGKKLAHYDGELQNFLTSWQNKVGDHYWQYYLIQKLLMSWIPGS